MEPKILTVDDSKPVRLIVKATLRHFACSILEAANGIQGLELAKQERPDLILLDSDMPLMDGVELLTSLKADSELRTIPVIVLTADSARANVLSFARLGVRGYVVKPFKKEVLLEKISQIIDLKPRKQITPQTRRLDDGLQILIVDDMPAILEQVKARLISLPWTFHGVQDADQAVAFCEQTLPDIILISLALPDDAAFTLFQRFRVELRTKGIPILALSVKTAKAEQTMALEFGFGGLIAKPIDPGDLQLKITLALGLDATDKYFQQREGLLVMSLPANFQTVAPDDISARVRHKAAQAVNAGLFGLVIDLCEVKSADTALIKLTLQAFQVCAELGFPCGLVAPETLSLEFKNFPETQLWKCSRSFQEAAALFPGTQPGTA